MKAQYIETAQKIILPAIVAGILFLSLVVFAEIGLNTVNGLLFQVVDKNAERTVLALGALDGINLATIKEKNALLEKDDAQLAKNIREYGELMRNALEKLDRLKVLTNPEDLSMLAGLYELAAQYRLLVEGTEFPLIKLGRMDEAYALSFKEGDGGGRTLRQTVRAGLEKIVGANRLEMAKNRQKAETTSLYTKNSLVLTAIIGLAFALVWISLVQITRPLRDKEVEIEGMDQKDKVAVVKRALEIFKDNASEAKRLAEAEEKDCERVLQSMKKDDT